MNFTALLVSFIPVLYVVILFVIIFYLLNILRRIAVALEQMANAQKALSDNLARLEPQKPTPPTPDTKV